MMSDALEKIDRHCGYCHTLISAQFVKKCSGCHRRAYCGIECQKKDWKSKVGDKYKGQPGQGHKDWCSLSCAEQDVDWEKKSPSSSDKGIVAIRKIPARSRIIVEGIPTKQFTSAGCSALKLISLVNHKCDSNADDCPDPEFRVLIIFAKRDIEIGEEITINFFQINHYSPDGNQNAYHKHIYDKEFITTFEDVRILLERVHKIICPVDCFCREKMNEEKLHYLFEKTDYINYQQLGMYEENKKLPEEMKAIKVSEGLSAVEDLLENIKTFNASPLGQAMILEKAFFIAMQTKETEHKGIQYITECYNIWSSILHPDSGKCKQLKEILDNPLPKFLEFMEIKPITEY